MPDQGIDHYTFVPKPFSRNRLQFIERLLILAPLRRVDRYLLMRHPLVWRTKVHYITWFSLIVCNGILFTLGKLIPMETNNVLTALQIHTIVGALWVLGAIALCYWCYLQYRNPLDELKLREYILTGVLYAMSFLFVLTNPISFVLPLMHRIAVLVPDNEFDREYSIHERYNFWCCNSALSSAVIESNRVAIAEALNKYGFTTEYVLFDLRNTFDLAETKVSFQTKMDISRACHRAGHCLIFRTVAGEEAPLLFGQRLQSIRAAKQFDNSIGIYFDRYARLFLILSVLLAIGLVIIVYPASARRRKFGREGLRPLLPQLRLPYPSQLTRLDLYLRTHHPLVWSARLHFALFSGIAYGSLLIFGIALVHWFSFSAIDLFESFVGSILTLGAIFSVIWGVRQGKVSINATNWITNQAAILLYFAVMLPFAIFLLVSLKHFLVSKPSDIAGVIILGAFGCLYVVILVFVRKYLDAKELAIAFSVSVGLKAAFIILSGTVGFSYSYIIIIGAVLFLPIIIIAATVWGVGIQTKKKAVSRRVNFLSGFYLVEFPFIFLVFIIPFFEEKGQILSMETMITLFPGAIPIYLLWASPAIRNLVRYRYWPKAV